MKTIPVLSKREIKRFHKVPFTVYKNDENWIPHIKQEVEDVFDEKKNHLFRKGVARRWILISDSGEDIGRISAFIDYRQSKKEKQPTGGFGFFESINDKSAAFTLFDTARKWLEDLDVQAMDGPINFGERNKYWGLLIDGYDKPPIYGNAYQPSYYRELFEEYGFQVFFTQHMYEVVIQDPMKEVFSRKINHMNARGEYSFRHIELSKLSEYAEDFRTVYNAAWQTHSSFKGISAERALLIFKKMKMVIDEKLVWFVYHNSEPVAFMVSLPELNEIFKYVNGNLNLLGKIKFLFYKRFRKPQNAFAVVFGVVPKHQKNGVESLMMQEIKKALKNHTVQYKKMIITWIGDFNPKMMHIVNILSDTPYQKLNTYRLLFDPNAEFERCEEVKGS